MKYTIGIVAALLLLSGAAVFAAPGDGSTNNGIIQGTKVDGKAIAPASVTTTGGVSSVNACSGACTAAGHSPYMFTEGPAEIDGVCYADGGIETTTLTASGLITANGGVALGASQDITCVGATGATCIYDELGATCGTRTDDANAVNRSINSSNVSPFAAAAKTPGSLVLQGGLDSKTVTCAVATCGGTDTVIVTRNINGTSTANTLTFGTDFCTAGSCTTNALMASSLAAAIEALTGVGSTASSDVAGVTADRQTYSIVLTDSNAHAACTVPSNGTDGGIIVLGGDVDTLRPAIRGPLAAQVGIGFDSNSVLLMDNTAYRLRTTSAGADTTGRFSASTYIVAGTYMQITPNATLGACAAAGDRGKLVNYLKADVTHLCYCKQTAASTYAWTTVFAGGDCT